jgi:hypothetical protein
LLIVSKKMAVRRNVRGRCVARRTSILGVPRRRTQFAAKGSDGFVVARIEVIAPVLADAIGHICTLCSSHLRTFMQMFTGPSHVFWATRRKFSLNRLICVTVILATKIFLRSGTSVAIGPWRFGNPQPVMDVHTFSTIEAPPAKATTLAEESHLQTVANRVL